MPLASASRGELKLASCPSISSCPSSGRNTPDSTLIRVDLPAPLSPSRHITSPPATAIEMSWSAITEPKNFDTSRASISAPLLEATSHLLRLAADEPVHEHRRQ